MHCLEVLGSGWTCISDSSDITLSGCCSSGQGQSFPKQSSVLSTLGRGKERDITARLLANFCSGQEGYLPDHPGSPQVHTHPLGCDKGERKGPVGEEHLTGS